MSKKKTSNTKDNIDISKFQNSKSLIINNSESHRWKKSLSVFKWDEIMEFTNSALNHIYLAPKISGYPYIWHLWIPLRCDELAKLKLQRVEDLDNKYLVFINDTKNVVPHRFMIGELFYAKFKQYVSKRPMKLFTDRFFVRYHNGKCQQQVTCRNKIGETPQLIASYLNLPNSKIIY